MANIESLLSARHFLTPQLVNDRIYFISNLSAHFSLYAMDYSGSVPEPLLPPDIALQNPELQGGVSYWVYSHLNKIVVSIDSHGDEKYRPMVVPLEGGIPDAAFPQLENVRVYFGPGEPGTSKLLLSVESLTEASF